MIKFFRKLFKRGDFMTRADKWYYKKVFSTAFWSVFAFVVISWVGSNLVLCALSAGFKSPGDIIYTAPHDVTLPIGQELNKLIKNTDEVTTEDKIVKTITFDKYTSNNTYFAGGSDLIVGIEPEIVNVDDDIFLYRLNEGADVIILSHNFMCANANSANSFSYFGQLQKITFNNYSTKNVLSMRYFCDHSSLLETLENTQDWDTQNVNDMYCMFAQCKSLSRIDGLGNWDTRSVTLMDDMFADCKAIEKLDMSEWDVSEVTNMRGLFDGCENLTTIKGLETWNTHNVKTMQSMFSGCQSLSNLDLSNFNTENVNTLRYIFLNCKALEKINLSSWDTSRVSDMIGLFDGCENLTTIKGLETWNTHNVTSMSRMFTNCKAFEKLDLSKWDVSQVLSMSSMFAGCKINEGLDLSMWDTRNVTTMSTIFQNADIPTLNLSGWWIAGSKVMLGSSVVNLYMDNCHLDKINSLNEFFRECKNLQNLSLVGWDLSGITSLSCAFQACLSLKTLVIKDWDTSQVTTMDHMFRECPSLEELDLSGWNTHNVTTVVEMFCRCQNLRTIYVGDGWDMSNVTEYSLVFYDCQVITGEKGSRPHGHGSLSDLRVDDPDNGNPGCLTYRAKTTE